MAKDVKFLITASSAKAEEEIRKLQITGKQTASVLEREFEQLSVKSSLAFENKRKAAQSAYDRIKTSGMATHDELTRAEAALGDKLVSLDEEQFGKRTGLLQKFKANWLAVTASIAAAWVVVSQGWAMANEAAQGLQQRQAFANLTASHNANATQIIADLKRVSAETVSTKELIEKAGTAMLLGIPAEKLSRLMEIARASSRVTGQTITKSFEDISLAVARGSRLILDNLGIIISEEKANKEYAATLGKTVEQLTDVEKKQAFLNATMAAGDKIIKQVGVTGETQAEKMQKFTARMQELKETVGVGLLAVLNVASGAMHGVAAAGLMFAGAVWRVHSAVTGLIGLKNYAAEMKINADAAFAAANDLASKGSGDLATAVDLVTGKLNHMNASTVKQTEAAGAAAEEEQKRKEVMKQAADAAVNYSRTIKDLGKEQLKLAEKNFLAGLDKQEEYFKKNQALSKNLASPLRAYLSVLDTIYDKQLDAQNKIESVLKKIGVERKVQLQQQIAALQIEKDKAEASLKVWGDYLGKLKGMHATVVEDIKKKQEELLQLQEYGRSTQEELRNKFFPPTPETDPYVKFYNDLYAADAAQAAAMQLNGDKRIEGIKKAIDALKTLPTEVKNGDAILISSLEIYERITMRTDQWQNDMEATKQAQINASEAAAKTLTDQIALAEKAMADFETQIISLDTRITALSRTVTLTLDDQVTPGLERIRSAIASLGGASGMAGSAGVSPFSGSSSVDFGTGWGTWSDGSSADEPSPIEPEPKASGGPVSAYATYRINEDGTEYLTMGSKGGYITPAGKGPAGNSAVNISGIYITLQSTGDAQTDVDAISRNLVPALRKKLSRSIVRSA